VPLDWIIPSLIAFGIKSLHIPPSFAQRNAPQAFAKLAAILSRLWFKPAPYRPLDFGYRFG